MSKADDAGEGLTLSPAELSRFLYALRSATATCAAATKRLETLAGLRVDPVKAHRQAKQFAAHVRHHVRTHKPSSSCSFCA